MHQSDLWAAINAAGPLACTPTFDPLLVDDVVQAERATAQYDRRRAFVATYAWAVPTPEAVQRVAAAVGSRKVLEVCAGTGLWARLLCDAGVAVVATDGVAPPQAWYPLEILPAADAVHQHRDCQALLLCWPPFKDRAAHDALEPFAGDLLVYIGDPRFTADRPFHALLREAWTLTETIGLPSWPGTRDAVNLYTRRR